ncbi:MAG: hypothetical protein EHM14_07840 [Methanothrix sp.]|nr:MAG: hypothetical protein EHM14_07840 [Methanothrix sp.]
MNQAKQKADCADIPGCIRSLSNVERLFLWSFQTNIAVAARITGDIDERNLERALDAVCHMHPLTRCRIVFDEHHDAWFSRQSVPRATLRIVPRTSDSQWFDEIRREYGVPFELEIGPLIRFVLVYSPKVSELMAFSEHCICDGTALANLMRDLLNCYANPKKEVQVISPPVITDYLKKEGGFSIPKIIGKFFINHYNNQWQKNPYYITQEDFNKIHAAYWEKYRYSIVFLQLEPEESSDLVARCRENEVTIGSALTTAFLAAYHEVIGPLPKNKKTISIPFDLRRHLENDIGECFCFLTGGFNFPFAYDQKKSFWKNAADLHKIIQKRVEMLDNSGLDMEAFDPTLIDAFFNLAPYIKIVPDAYNQTENLSAFANDKKSAALKISNNAVSKLPGLTTTNLGHLDFPEIYGSLRLDRLFLVPSAGENIPLILGGAGVCGKIVFSLNYLEQKNSNNPPPTRDMIRIRNIALEYLGFPEKANESLM